MSESTGTPRLTLEHTAHLDSALLEAMPGGVVFVKPDGSISAANQAALSLLGMSYDSLTNRYVSDFTPQTIHEDGTPCPPEEYPVAHTLSTGEPHPGLTLGVKRPDETIVWAVFRATPVADADGRTAGAIVTFFDITARKTAEGETLRAQERLRHAQDLAKVGWWEMNLATGQVTWSDQMCAIHGVRPEEFSGTLDASLEPMHPDDRPMISERVGLAIDKGVPMPSEYRAVHPDGSIRVVWAVAELIYDGQGTPTRMRGAAQDITARKELEEQLMQVQRMDSVGQLAGGIAHDFNNLLQVILGNALSARGLPDCSLELEYIVTAAKRAAELTKQLLAFGRRQSFSPHILNANELVRVIEQMLVRTLAGTVELEVLPQAEDAFINADRNQLEQVLMNLCLNARDAVKKNGKVIIATESIVPDREFREERSWAVMKRYMRISVSDNGSGMTPEVMRRVFEPFFTTKPVGSGSGLGLAAVYGITQQHSGMVEVSSEPGQGTTFHLYIPQVDSGRASAEMRAPEEAKVKEDANSETTSHMVLVVDDDEMVLGLALRTLRRCGLTAISAERPHEALRIMEEQGANIPVVVTDMVMPEMDGHELAQRIHQIAPNTLVLYATGHSKEKLSSDIPKEHVLTKPYEPAQLCARVREVLEQAASTKVPSEND